MESKFAHIIVFFLLATSFKTLMAQKESDGPEVIELLKEIECKGKLKWSELTGVPIKIAEGIIERENPLITDFEIIQIGSPVTADFSCNRVRLFVNILGDVLTEPVVG